MTEETKIKMNFKNLKASVMLLEDYITMIYSKCEKTFSLQKKSKIKNVSSDTNLITIPTLKEAHILCENNFNVQELKQIAKHYKIKISGNKEDLIKRIYVFFKLSSVVVSIQKVFRGFLQRKYNECHGPAFCKRNLCTNATDFLTIEDVETLPYSQFYSYKDVDGFIYGFDIISLYNLITKSGKNVKNPYNRNDIPNSVIRNIRNMIRLSKILKIQVDIELQDVNQEISNKKNIELRALDLFQFIDGLGNYSDPSWLLSLSRHQIVRFMRELIDIWNYRLNLTNIMKQSICPPHGDPFRNVSSLILNEQNIDTMRKHVLICLERLVMTGIDKDWQSLGAYYVLGALTIVNENASTSLPWLYQSFSNTLI
jgi:hypothetical protein